MSVLNWATTAGDGHSRGRLLDRNPLKGLKVPKEENPQRVWLEDAEYRALRRVAVDLDWRFELALILTHETGSRIGAIRRLRWSDLDLEKREVRWRKEFDKMGYERSTPLTGEAVQALHRMRRLYPGLGEAWVLPAPQDPSEPCRGDLMTKWWNRAVKLAGLEPKQRRGWHSLRRKLATDLKAAPAADLLHLGGWKSMQTVTKCYQSADEGSMRASLEGRSQKAG